MSNININGKTAVHKKSKGILTTTDVCMTPPFCVPIPYTNIAESKTTDMGATSVKIEGSPACNAKSNFKISQGDAPGACAGVMSGSIGQMAEFITFSPTVKIEGKPAVRNGDTMVSNMKNTAPMPLMQPPAGIAPAGTAKAPKALEKEKFSLRWQALSPSTGEPMKDSSYSIIRKDGTVIKGKTGADGRTERIMTEKPEYVTALIGEGNWMVHSYEFATQVEPETEDKQDKTGSDHE